MSSTVDSKERTTQWARILKHQELSVVVVPAHNPAGDLRHASYIATLDYAVYSEKFRYCFNLPRNEVRPEVLNIFDNTIERMSFDLSIVMGSFTHPHRGVPKGEEGFWINCMAHDLQILLKEDRSEEFLQALLHDTINKLPDNWFAEKEWKIHAIERLCAILKHPEHMMLGSGQATTLGDILQTTENEIYFERWVRETNFESLELYGETMAT